jgi:hypothetical protein
VIRFDSDSASLAIDFECREGEEICCAFTLIVSHGYYGGTHRSIYLDTLAAARSRKALSARVRSLRRPPGQRDAEHSYEISPNLGL